MKHFKKLAMTIVALWCCIAANAYDFEVDGICYNITSEDNLTVEVTKNSDNRYSGEVIIPSVVAYNGKSYSVTSIGGSAFSGCTGLTSITIPDGVTEIGQNTFYGCTSLPIKDNVRYADKWAIGVGDKTTPNYSLKSDTRGLINTFSGCTNLARISIPETVVCISGDVFSGCSLLKSVKIPTDATIIGDATFKNCSSLTSVNIPSKTKNIGDSTFYDCKKLTSITIPESVTSIGDMAFYNCDGLEAVHIKDIVAWCNISFFDIHSNPLYHHGSTDYRPFYLNGEELTDIVLPNDVTNIAQYAFYGCIALTSITIPEGVTEIKHATFGECYNLSSVTLPESLTSIGTFAFGNCTGLKSITIPKNVTSIAAKSAFRAYFDDWYLKTVTINSPAIMEAGDFKNIFGPYVTTYNIGAEIDELKDVTFFNYTNLKTVTLPKTLTRIGESAFDRCSALTSINIPSKVNSIGAYAFAGCMSLNSVTSENTVPPVCSEGVFEEVSTSKCKLIVPQASLTTYKETKPWSEFMIIGDEDLAGIDDIVKQDGTATIYTIDGKQVFKGKVQNASEATQDLPSGVYVVNGKKVVVK